MAKPTFGKNGFDLNAKSANMTYLYGISDFWSVLFENADVVNSMLEATTMQLSNVYNRFLQLSSSFTLDGITEFTGSQIDLVVLDETEHAVAGETHTFLLPKKMKSTRYIANRPFMPTATLEEGVHFSISADGTSISFYSALSSLKMPKRVSIAKTVQYSLWFIDTTIDENLVYNYYGKFVSKKSDAVTERYKDFISGLFYLYLHGPTVRDLVRGLNLVMGVPLARQDEKVLLVDRLDSSTDYTIITTNNSYVVPYGLKPTIVAGDTIHTGDPVASWVQVLDYVKDGEWWLYHTIPREIIEVPLGQENQLVATPGSDTATIMSKYLKNHTFMVKISLSGVDSVKLFTQLQEVVSEAKPSYTFPIYVWEIPLEEEAILLSNTVSLSPKLSPSTMLNSSNGEVFRRDMPMSSVSGVAHVLYKGAMPHTMYDLPFNVYRHMYGPGSYPQTITDSGYTINDYINIDSVWDKDQVNSGWIQAISSRNGSDPHLVDRQRVMYNNYIEDPLVGQPVGIAKRMTSISSATEYSFCDVELIPLYCVRAEELKAKLDSASISHETTLPREFVIEKNLTNTSNRDLLCVRDYTRLSASVGTITWGEDYKDYLYLGAWIPHNMYLNRTLSSYGGAGSYLVAIQSINDIWGVYLKADAIVYAKTGPFFILAPTENIHITSTVTKAYKSSSRLGNTTFNVRDTTVPFDRTSNTISVPCSTNGQY